MRALAGQINSCQPLHNAPGPCSLFILNWKFSTLLAISAPRTRARASRQKVLIYPGKPGYHPPLTFSRFSPLRWIENGRVVDTRGWHPLWSKEQGWTLQLESILQLFSLACVVVVDSAMKVIRPFTQYNHREDTKSESAESCVHGVCENETGFQYEKDLRDQRRNVLRPDAGIHSLEIMNLS